MAVYKEISRRKIVIYNPIKDIQEDPEIDYNKLCEKYYLDKNEKIFEIDVIVSIIYPSNVTINGIEIEYGTVKSSAKGIYNNLKSNLIVEVTDITSKNRAINMVNYWNLVYNTNYSSLDELRNFFDNNVDPNKHIIGGLNFGMYYLPAVGKINVNNAISIINNKYAVSVLDTSQNLLLSGTIDASYLSPKPILLNPMIIYTKIFCCCDMPEDYCMEHFVTPLPKPINC